MQKPCLQEWIIKPGILIHITNEYGEVKEDYSTPSVEGNIHDLKTHAFDCFSSQTCEWDYTRISALRFTLVPGWDENEYRPEIRQLWADVRRIAQEYSLEE